MTSKEIVELIEAELEKQHKTKGEFFETCGVTRAQMSNWRREKNYPQTPVLITISDYLGIDLLGKKEAPPANDGEGRYGLREQDWWAIGHWFKHELDVMAHPPEYLANKSGIPLGRVEAFLAGSAELSKAELEALAKVIGKPLGEIIHGYATAFEKDDNPVDISVLLQRFGSLPPEQQKRLFHSVELLGEVGSDSSHLLELFESALENQKRTSQD